MHTFVILSFTFVIINTCIKQTSSLLCYFIRYINIKSFYLSESIISFSLDFASTIWHF